MVDAAELHPLAELVGLEFEDRHVERAVGEEDPVGEDAVGPADLDKIKRLFVELGHRLRVFGGDRDVTQLGHRVLPLEISHHSEAREIPARSAASPLPTRPCASSKENSANLSNSGSMLPFQAKHEVQD